MLIRVSLCYLFLASHAPLLFRSKLHDRFGASNTIS